MPLDRDLKVAALFAGILSAASVAGILQQHSLPSATREPLRLQTTASSHSHKTQQDQSLGKERTVQTQPGASCGVTEPCPTANAIRGGGTGSGSSIIEDATSDNARSRTLAQFGAVGTPQSSQVVSGDGGAFFASATGKGLTCYGVTNGATTEYAAKPDINGVLTCSQAQQRLAGLGAANEGAAGLPPTAHGSFIPDRTWDTALGGPLNRLLDNPGRIPGQYALALELLLAAPNPAPNIGQARLIAGEAQATFLHSMPAPLPRSLSQRTLLPSTKSYGPDYYSSSLGGPQLMLQLLKLAILDPVASKMYLPQSIKFAECMMMYGTDRYGSHHSPLFASVLILQRVPVLPTNVMLSQWAPKGGGIFRPFNFPNVFPGTNGSGPAEQVYWGANVASDQALYQFLYLLTTATGDPKYSAAADAALSFFLASCLVPESGLLAWGAHAQWDFYEDTYAHGVQSYKGKACCPLDYQLHQLVSIPDTLWAKMWALNETAMEIYMGGLLRGSVVNIHNPSAMAYDGRAALWASPRSAAASSSSCHASIQPPLSQVTQAVADGKNLLRAGALGISLSTNTSFRMEQETLWVAFATGIIGQKTKYLTPYYPDGNFTMDGHAMKNGLKRPTEDIGSFALQAAQLLPTTGIGSKYRASLLQLFVGATLDTGTEGG